MAINRTVVPCEACCIGRWNVSGITYQPLNAAATCTATGGLVPGGGCVTGTPSDAVRASVVGSISIACRTPLTGNDGKPFPNPCLSKSISWLSISAQWEFLEAAGAITIMETGCTAIVKVMVEDCPEYGPATAEKDLLITFFLGKCSESCSGGLGT